MQEPKRRGRPPKIPPAPPTVGPTADSRVSGEAKTFSGVVQVNPRETNAIPGAAYEDEGGFLSHITPELAARIRECNQVYIVCKTVNAKEVTVNHSRHDALWMKEYV